MAWAHIYTVYIRVVLNIVNILRLNKSFYGSDENKKNELDAYPPHIRIVFMRSIHRCEFSFQFFNVNKTKTENSIKPTSKLTVSSKTKRID